MQRPLIGQTLDLNAYAAGAGGSAGEIVKSMLLPEEYGAIRMKDAFTNVKTAVANPFDEIPNNWTTPDSSGVSWMAGLLFRGTLLNAMILDANPNSSTYTYLWSLSDGTTTISIPANSQRKFAPIYASASTSYRPHGDTLWNQFDQNGDPYFWCDASVETGPAYKGTISITKTGAWTGSATLYKYDGSQGQEVAVKDITSGDPLTVTFSLADPSDVPGGGPGLYRVELMNDSAVTGTFTVSYSNAGGHTVWQQLVLPGYENNVNNVSNIRIIGAAVKWRNTTSDQYVNGRVAAVQFGKGQSVQEVISGGPSGMFQFISGVREGVTRDFKRGFYGFLKPAEDNDLAYNRPLTANTSLVWSGGEPAAKRSGFLAFVAQVVSGNGAPATNTQMRRSVAVEYQTNNLWAEVRNPSSDRRVWEQACATIAMIPQFHENPSHFAEIVHAIMNGGAIAADQIAPVLRKFDNDTAKSIAAALENYISPGLRLAAPFVKRGIQTLMGDDDDDDVSRRAAIRRRYGQ